MLVRWSVSSDYVIVVVVVFGPEMIWKSNEN